MTTPPDTISGLIPFYASLDPCDLGEYLEHPDGTLESLPLPHGLTNEVLYNTGASYRHATPLPVRKIGAPHYNVGILAPQPAPRYIRLRYGRQVRTGAPA